MTDDIPDYCAYNVNGDGTWQITANVDWGQTSFMGPFKTIEEAKRIGKINGCPN